MIDLYEDKLLLCANEEEVWQLMNDLEFPGSNGSKFKDDVLLLQLTNRTFSPVKPPDGLIGLAYRVVLFLKLNGVFGKVILGAGIYTSANNLKRVIRELSNYTNIKEPRDISTLIINKYIEVERSKGKSPKTIYSELYQLIQWNKNNHRLPYFLRIDSMIFKNSLSLKELKFDYEQYYKDYANGLGEAKEPYPLDQMAVIVREAIDYIEYYSLDCIRAARIYKEINKDNVSNSKRLSNLVQIFLNTNVEYTEPYIQLVQKHIKNMKKNYWIPIPTHPGYGPIKALLNSIRKLQSSCVIVVLLLTAMRRGEFDTLERYPEIRKTGHHELDGSLELTRIIHKTSLNKKGKPLTMPVPPVALSAIDLLSQLSEINDGAITGYLNISDISFQKDEQTYSRIDNLIQNFCSNIEIEAPTPHQFRHSMAFIVAYMNDAKGIELAMTILGHSSTEMTKKYLGYFKKIVQKSFDIMYLENEALQETYNELKETLDKEALEKIINQIEKESPLVGPVVKRITQFSGSLTTDAKIAFTKSLRLVVEKGKYAVTQFPTHFCIKDLTDSTQMACQIGLNLDDYIGAPVVPSQCEPRCANRLYTGENIGELKSLTDLVDDSYPDELRERLIQNTYFDVESFSDPFSKYIKEYEEIERKRSFLNGKVN